MEKTSVNLALKEGNFKLGPLGEAELRAMVRAMLTLSTRGVLATGLDHTPLGCNAMFGQIFQVDPETVPNLQVEELREFVYPRLSNPSEWVKNLDDVYEDPLNVYSDEIELSHPHLWIRRATTPMVDSDGGVLGRLWLFDDITEEKARAERREVTQRISTFHHPDPRVVYQAVVDSVGDHYQTTAILSINEGDMMIFRAITRPAFWIENVPANTVRDSICQLVLENEKAALVQNASLNPRLCEMLGVQMGLIKRYLGVPLLTPKGKVMGTLCIIDAKSDDILGEEDAEFMAVMANRISVELERERLYESRNRDQKLALERQQNELATTRVVLQAMNESVTLLESADNEADLLRLQEKLLQGILGCVSVSLHSGPAQIDAAHSRTWTLEDESFSLEFFHPSDCFAEDFLDAHISAISDQTALTLARFRLKRALLQANEHLRVAQGQLIQAEKLGVVGTLAASVAHDIRNIMASIALEAASCDDPAEVLGRVRAQVERFSVLSHRLLSYVKPKYMARDLVNLNLVATRALELLDSQIRVSKVKLTVDLADNLPTLQGDPNQVEHLFVNLLVNALQAVSRSQGSLTIRSVLDGDAIRFTLSDNGRGMSQETLGRIFDPFYSSRPDGFGLGLYSCKRIANEHGWSLVATSAPNEGSEFVITIPLRKTR